MYTIDHRLIELKDKLAPANNTIAKIACQEKNITPVTLEDRQLFEDFFAKEKKHTYGNSWIYVSQGVYGIGPNNLGYKYYDGRNLCMLCAYPKVESPEIIMLYWIRPLGDNILPIIVERGNYFKQKYRVASYVKKIFKEQHDYLIVNGFKSSKEFPWHTAFHAEDDTYPEVIFDLADAQNKILAATRRSRLGRTMQAVNKLSQVNLLELTGNNFQEHAWQITKHYFSEHAGSVRKINISSPADYYNMIFHSNNELVDKKIIRLNNHPVGFYVLKHDKQFNTANLYSCVTMRQHYRNLSDYVYLNLFKQLKARYINVGGSEDFGIHDFKMKFKPAIQNPMYWATNYGVEVKGD